VLAADWLPRRRSWLEGCACLSFAGPFYSVAEAPSLHRTGQRNDLTPLTSIRIWLTSKATPNGISRTRSRALAIFGGPDMSVLPKHWAHKAAGGFASTRISNAYF